MAKKYGDLFSFHSTKDEVNSYSDPISTGSLVLDLFLDGGYRVGAARFYGPSEHGKTAQCLVWAREWMKKFKDKAEVIYFDAEGRITLDKIKTSGLALLPNFKWSENAEDESANFFLFNYNTYDHIADFIFDKIRDNKDLPAAQRKRFFIVIDSLDQLITSKDMEKSFSDSEKVGAAQTISALLSKKVTAFMSKYGHHLHILSQIRANINTSSHGNGPTTKASGGNSMLHISNMTGAIQKDWSGTLLYENPKGTTIAEKGDVIGRLHTIKFEKTFNEKTHRVVRVPIKFKHGIWREREIVDLIFVAGVATMKGSWVSVLPDFVLDMKSEYGVDIPEKIQGYANFVALLENSRETSDALEKKIRNLLMNFTGEEVGAEEADDEA